MAQISSGMTGSNHWDEGRVSPAPLSEAAALMGAGQNRDEAGEDIRAESGSHRVKDLIHRFDHLDQSKQEVSQESGHFKGDIKVEETIFPSTVAEEESMPRSIIEKTASKVKVLSQRLDLPQSSMEQHLNNNIHVPHPDKLIGGMVGLGMNIQKGAKGHLVHSVIPDGLAAKSNLQENDVIISVNGSDVTSWEFEELQHFFGSLGEVELKIVVERQEEDNNGNLLCRKATISITISLEGDRVIAELDVKVKYNRWQWNGESEPHYVFQNNRGQSTQFLTLKDECFCMSTGNDLTPSRFKFFYYRPVDNGPRAIINLKNNSPLDHGEPSRIGEYSADLRKGLYILSDDRIFFIMKQDNTARYTFQLASRIGYYLTTDANGNLTTTNFRNIEAVDKSGQFNIVPSSKVDKMTPSERQKYNPKLQGKLKGKLKSSKFWK